MSELENLGTCPTGEHVSHSTADDKS